jgi:plastocyanin
MEEEVTMEDEGITEEEAMVKEFDVKAGGFYFEPNVMRVKLGDTVRIILNAADMTHDFVIDELGVRSSVIAGGDSTSVEFIADQLGEFEYYCGVSNHRQLGMTGTLIIEE